MVYLGYVLNPFDCLKIPGNARYTLYLRSQWLLDPRVELKIMRGLQHFLEVITVG
jgi:hypothetical protein